MAIKKIKIYFCIILVLLLFQHKAYGKEDKNLYDKGFFAAKKGKLDFAFINFYKLLREFPGSQYREQALFAVAEYYILIGDRHNAIKSFEEFTDKFPSSSAWPFATAYLLQIAKKQKEQTLINKLQKDLIASQQVSLVFREFKELEYKSAFNTVYRALIFIDKIKIYVDGDLFLEISY